MGACDPREGGGHEGGKVSMHQETPNTGGTKGEPENLRVLCNSWASEGKIRRKLLNNNSQPLSSSQASAQMRG